MTARLFWFPLTACSQCGGEFGPGTSGFSHCRDHTPEARARLPKTPPPGAIVLSIDEAIDRASKGMLPALYELRDRMLDEKRAGQDWRRGEAEADEDAA